MAGGEDRKYTCNTASETLEWINAIINFIEPYRFFLDAHVVNYFKDRLWKAVDEEWMDCLQNEPVENLVLIPSGVVQGHWPHSLKKFILTLRHLSLSREQVDLQKEFPCLDMVELNSVLAQGMNPKKKHEIEALAGIVGSVARKSGAETIVDVGSGQGYLAQVLSFQNQLSVYAIDASSHHGRVTDARAERIRKHYAAKIRKSRCARSEDIGLRMPKTVTCRVLTSDMLTDLSNSILKKDHIDLRMPKTVTCRVLTSDMLTDLSNSILKKDHIDFLTQPSESVGGQPQEKPAESGHRSTSHANCSSSLVLAGLHACGDLSVTMLRTFMDCEEVKAVVSIGCCYNLLSEEYTEESDVHYGFPLSNGVRCGSCRLGKNARDLACQSAERWRLLGKAAGLNNFELHAFRAAFQMVLFQYYPEKLISSPTIGRQGKALRRQQQWKILESSLNAEEPVDSSESTMGRSSDAKESQSDIICNGSGKGEWEAECTTSGGDKSILDDKFPLFVKFCESGFCRLGLPQLQDADLYAVWKETKPFAELIGPYWSLRAALGPVLETIILLDRLLFLQEQGNSLDAVMLPIFDPKLSPRNMALIAWKV